MAIDVINNTGNQGGTIDIQPLAASKSQASNIKATSKTDSKGSGEASLSQIQAAITGANYKAVRTRYEFAVDEATQRISIKVIDKETEDVIREIPPEESLAMLAKIWELAGLIMDEKR